LSRSRRHSPVVTDQQRTHNVKRVKRTASKAARRSDLPDGNAYRKVFNSWNICDYKSSLWWGRGYWDNCDRRWYAK
jgi:hypothetical protein